MFFTNMKGKKSGTHPTNKRSQTFGSLWREFFLVLTLWICHQEEDPRLVLPQGDLAADFSHSDFTQIHFT